MSPEDLDRITELLKHAHKRQVDAGHLAFSTAAWSVLQWFHFKHLPPHLQDVSARFAELACAIAQDVDSDEAIVALRKLLEAKDAAVRARIEVHRKST